MPEVLGALKHALAHSRPTAPSRLVAGAFAHNHPRPAFTAYAGSPTHTGNVLKHALNARPFATSTRVRARIAAEEQHFAGPWGWHSNREVDRSMNRRRRDRDERSWAREDSHAKPTVEGKRSAREEQAEGEGIGLGGRLRRAMFGFKVLNGDRGGQGMEGYGWQSGKSPFAENEFHESAPPPASPPSSSRHGSHRNYRSETDADHLVQYTDCGPWQAAPMSSSKAFRVPQRPAGEWVGKKGPGSCIHVTSGNSHSYGSGEKHHTTPDHHPGAPFNSHPHCSHTRQSCSSSSASTENPSSHADFSSSNHSSSHSPPPDGDPPERTASWFWYLVANERRRRDPGRKRHVQRVMRNLDVVCSNPQGHGHVHRVGPGTDEGARGCFKGGHQIGKGRRGRKAREELQKLERKVVAGRMGRVLQFRAAAARSGAASGASGPGGTGSRSGPFNYDAFRESLWFSRMHPLRDQRIAASRGTFQPRYREVKPQEWVREVDKRRRLKCGAAFFADRYACSFGKMQKRSHLTGGGRRWSGEECSRRKARRERAEAKAAKKGLSYFEGKQTPDANLGAIKEGMHGGKAIYLGKAPASPEAPNAGAVNPCYLYRNELTARLATASAARLSTPRLLFLTRSHALLPSHSAARAFSTSAPRRVSPLVNAAASASIPGGTGLCPLELALPFLVPLTAVLKSSAALNVLTILSRLSLTLLPLSLRGKLFNTLQRKYAADPSSFTSTVIGRACIDRCGHNLASAPGLLSRVNAAAGLPLLLLAPVFMLAIVAIASLERTPVTGRWRVVMLSPAEEAELVGGILSPAPSVPVQEGTSRDWVSILRRVLTLPNEGISESTGRRILLGGEVLDQRDWRVRWAEAVLRALEQGGEGALVASAARTGGVEGVLRPPPTEFPLRPREEREGEWTDELMLARHLAQAAAAGAGAAEGTAERPPKLRVEYDLLVIDRPDANAFSFGFGPDVVQSAGREGEKARRGVIVVYTGFIDEILSSSPSSVSLPPTPPPSPPQNPSSLFSRSSSPSHSKSAPSPNSIEVNLVPPVLPTQAQTKALAVLLSHELAHLVLDHTLESHASSGLLVPHLARLGSDVLRTVLYPITFFLGPFLNDALGRSLNEGALGGFGVLGKAVNSCESRKLEGEADRVALRLLASSGIDPHFALTFWEDRLTSSTLSSSSPSTTPPPTFHSHSHSHIHPHSPSSPVEKGNEQVLDGLLRSHPVDEERVKAIRDELKGWERWWSQRTPAGVAP
ncbi:hypothetical protein JCM11641_005755 [Rhodosporidiobolus odoratus]